MKQKCLTKGSVVRCTVTRPLWLPFFYFPISLRMCFSVCTREPFARKLCYLSASSTVNLSFYLPRGLSSNEITTINQQTFAGLKALDTLWVNHDNILTLHLAALTICQTWLTNPQMEHFSSAKLRAGLDRPSPALQGWLVWSQAALTHCSSQLTRLISSAELADPALRFIFTESV